MLNKMKQPSLVFLSVLASSVLSLASEQTSQELSCRAKAKEVAAESYRSCVTEFKSAEIERLHKNYQKRLKALKDNYEKEVESLSGETSTPKSKSKKLAKGRHSTEDSAEVKSSSNGSTMSDDSMMDIPEPVPVEN